MNFKNILFSLMSFVMISGCCSASLLYNLDFGVNEFYKDNYNLANDYLKYYVKSNPNDKDGYYWLARTYASIKNDTMTNKYFKKAYELTLKEKNIEKIDLNLNVSANFEDYFDMAVMYFEIGDLDQAEAYVDMMLKVNSKSPSAYFLKAKIAQENNEIAQATQYINQAIIYNNKLINSNLAKSLNVSQIPEMTTEMYEVFALEAYFSSDINSAIKYCKKYLGMDSNNIDMKNLLIDLYIKNNELSFAQNLIDEMRNSKNINIETLLYQAQIYRIRQDDKEEDVLLEAYKINPNNQNVLLNLANYYLNKKDYDNSKKYFEILVNVDDSMYEAYFGYIYSLNELGQIDEAMNLVRKLVSLNPDSIENDYLLAKICEKGGNYYESVEYLTQAIKKVEHPIYYLERAKMNYILKNYKESKYDAQKALNNAFDDITKEEAYEYLVKNSLKLNDIMNAQIYMNSQKGLDKNRLIYKYNLYVMYKLQGNNKRANEVLEEITKTKPKTSVDYVDLSEIYFDLEKYPLALKTIDKGIRKKPEEISLYSQKAKIYNLLDKKNQAKEVFKNRQ